MTEFSLFSDIIEPATLGGFNPLSRLQRLSTLTNTALAARIDGQFSRQFGGRFRGFAPFFGGSTSSAEARARSAAVAASVREYSDLVYPFPVKTASLLVQGCVCDVAYVDESPASGSQLASAPASEAAETIVFVHGLGSSIPAWQKMIPHLHQQYRCIALDLPGFGRSAKSPARLQGIHGNASGTSGFPISMAFFSDVVIALLDTLGVRHATLCGHSMGGQVALTTALRHRERVWKLVVVNSAGLEPFSPRELDALRKAVGRGSMAEASEAEVRGSYRLNFYAMPPDAEQMVNERLALRSARDFDAYCAAQRASVLAMVNGQVRDRLPEITQPTLIVFGENDALIPNPILHGGTPTDVARSAQKLIPQSSVVMIPRCGHFSPFEKPDAVNAALTGFLG
jgi:pimeloyl-ACP methyl ester carboxylesterase